MTAGAHDERREELRRVLESDLFRNSDSLRRLLAYLGERALSGKSDELKEYVIGVEVFGKSESYDPQKDASVRVQIGRLRQKLDEFYQADPGSSCRLALPKGHFTILFEATSIPASPPPPSPRARARPTLIVTAGLLAVSLVATALLWRRVNALESRLPGNLSGDHIAVWAPFWNPEIPNVAVFGSPAFFASASRDVFVRMYRPADPDDPRSSPSFDELNARIGPLQGPRYDYASMGDAIGLQRLTAFFGSHGATLRAVPAHLAVWESIQDANLIFLGAPRMNPLLRRLPIRQDFEFGADNYVHNHKPQVGEESVYQTASHRDSLSYAVVGSYAGLKPGREILVLSGHSTGSIAGAIDFLTTVEGARLLAAKLKLGRGERKHFEALLRVYTDHDSPVKTEYVTHHVQ